MIKRLKAITLIETLVYVSIFGVFMVVLIQFFLSVQFNQDKILKELELEINQIFITNHFRETVGENFAFKYENNTVIFFNASQTLEYKISNGNLVLVENGEDKILSNGKALVTDFSIETIGDNSAVRLTVFLEHQGDENIKRNFSNLIKFVNYE
jgi:type II secretory pathway pseudopilin PulG